jgi:hypothetical protein
MYVKLYSSILDSSVWACDVGTRIVWVALLAMADQDGFVRASPSGLARRANVNPEECLRACAILEAPDPESTNPDNDGRRVEHIESGWQILNYALYRSLQDPDVRRQQTKERVRKHRELKRSVTHSNAPKRQAEAEAKAYTKAKETATDLSAAPTRASGTSLVVMEKLLPSLRETAVQEKAVRRATVQQGLDLAADVVFRYWRDSMGFDPARTLLNEKRKTRIIARLRENGGDVSELLYVVDGALKDEWTMGRAPNSVKPYNGTETIFRDREKVEDLVKLVKKREAMHPYLESHE